MRYYLIENENEYIIDLTKTEILSSDLVEFEFSTLKKNELINKKTVFVRKLAGQYFASFDQQCWNKIPRQNMPRKMIYVDKVIDLYRGYKPSGLAASGEGDLNTQMPGKVVKILAKTGDQVSKGQTLLILEAMKMENEMRSNIDGVIKEIHVKEGQALEQGVLMIEIAPLKK